MSNIDSTPSMVATAALTNIPFSSIIGAPLDACIEAQAKAAQKTWEFIHEVGLQESKNDDKTKEAVNVSFTFISDGKIRRLNIPLLTILPIPYIAIQNIDVAFKANISASSSYVKEDSSSSEGHLDGEAQASLGLKWGLLKASLNLKGGYSSKKDSRATQDSRYSVEYTIDVGLRAGQDSMPAGLAKVLEILNGSLSMSDPDGELAVNDTSFEIEKETDNVNLIVTYLAANGVYSPGSITVDCLDGGAIEKEDTLDKKSMVYQIKKGTYIVSAGGYTQEVHVNLKGQ